MVLIDGFATQAAAAGTPTQLPADIGHAIRALAALGPEFVEMPEMPEQS
jgi:hypothetical protein